MVLDEPGALDKHATRTTGRVQDEAVIGFDDLDDEPDQAGRGEELPALLPFLHRELPKEVFIDLPERITLHVVRDGGEDPDQFEEGRVVNPLVVLRQHVAEFLVLQFDGLHRVVDGLTDIRTFGEGFEIGEAGLVGDIETNLILEIDF